MVFDGNPYLLALFTGFGTVLSEGYRRFFTDQHERERVDLLQKKAELAVTMSTNNLTIEDLEAAAGTIIADKREERTVSVVAKADVESSLKAEYRASRGWTQSEMNQQSAIDVRDADNDLDSTILDLRRFLDDEEQQSLDQVQSAWRAFRQAQGAFVGSQWQGGSMQPLMVNLELANVTKRRVVELREILADLSDRRVPQAELNT